MGSQYDRLMGLNLESDPGPDIICHDLVCRYSVNTRQSSFRNGSGAGWLANTTGGACAPLSTFSAASGG